MSHVTQQTKSTDMEGLLQQAFHVCEDCIEALRAHCSPRPEVEYFLDAIRAYHEPGGQTPKIILFGMDYPAEIVHALTGKPPYYMIGGNRIFADASDEFVPRDTDPVTRAILGQMFAMEHMREHALVIIPCVSDARRKAAHMLQDHGWNVVSFWLPADHRQADHRVYLSELKHSIRAISRHAGRRYSSSALRRSIQVYEQIRASIRAFTAASKQMPGPLRMAILDSFYMAPRPEEWRQKLDGLTAALSAQTAPTQNKPRVLLAGSPVYVPNDKIPSLVMNSGLDICAAVDSNTALLDGQISEKGSLSMLAAHYFDHNASAAFVNNTALHHSIISQVEQEQPDGIIWHVLKGQIEYDFELVRNERYFEERGLPAIRLETDYQYQDIEQLRIRIEAFAELLTQKKMEKGDLHE